MYAHTDRKTSAAQQSVACGFACYMDNIMRVGLACRKLLLEPHPLFQHVSRDMARKSLRYPTGLSKWYELRSVV